MNRRLFDLLEINVFSHGVFRLGRFGSFGRRLALLRVGTLERAIGILRMLLHIPELLANVLRGPEDGQEEIKDEFVQQVQYDPQKKYIC